jgi:S-adenosylmethionine:diacylglycerol 3-amino-3-carboxypropyl transferase
LVVTATAETTWRRGRFDARLGRQAVLFGRMYEDPAIELAAFRPGGRVFCIASAGCTAMALARSHEVTAADVNPVQLAYAERRIAGGPSVLGSAEKVMAFGRALTPLLGWRRARVDAFLDLADPGEQASYWRRYLDTWRFRAALEALLSTTALSAVYAPRFLGFLPRRLGAVMRARLARGFATHPNRDNPFARALLLGELAAAAPLAEAGRIRLVLADAAAFLEAQPAASFDGFSLSNILDGAGPGYARRLFAAVRHAAAPGALAVLRSFGEPEGAPASNRAAQDRALLWGIVDVRPARELA